MKRRIVSIVYLLLFTSGECLGNCKPSIAIVGGGIGGSSASHFISELFGENVKIDLYEAEYIGGRLATINIDEREYESGGSIIHSKNRYMQLFTKMLGLEQLSGEDGITGIWNGDEFVFISSAWKILSAIKLIYRYGLQPIKLQRSISAIMTDFEKIYDLQDAGKSFANVTALLAAMNENFPKMLQKSMETYFLEKEYDERFIEEFMKTTVVVNYGQGTDIHSFVGSVSLATIGSDLWSVKGGNNQVARQLILKNNKVTVMPLRVTKIVNGQTKDNENPYELYVADENGSDLLKAAYNIVILATPLTQDQKHHIAFEGFPIDNNTFSGTYHTTIATFVKADINPKYFNLAENLDDILSCNPNKTIINSIGRLSCVQGPSEADRRTWKLFSNAPLKHEIINEIFTNVDEVKEVIWKAYPQYSTNSRLEKFKLHDALYHINAIEWAASAMEMSAIGGRNVALLAFEDFSRKCNLKRPSVPRHVEL